MVWPAGNNINTCPGCIPVLYNNNKKKKTCVATNVVQVYYTWNIICCGPECQHGNRPAKIEWLSGFPQQAWQKLASRQVRPKAGWAGPAGKPSKPSKPAGPASPVCALITYKFSTT